MNISLQNLTMYFTGSISDNYNPNLRITFFPGLYYTGDPTPIPGEEPIAFAIGSADNKLKDMDLVIQSPNLIGTNEGFGAFTGHFVLTQADAETFCPEP